MMKRPRSFISTLIVFLSLATVPLGLTVKAHDANAGGMPREMDPRAGDPTQPGDGFIPLDDSIREPAAPSAITSQTNWIILKFWAYPAPFGILFIGRWSN